MHVITDVAVEKDRKLRLTYADGVDILIDFQPVIETGGVFARLADVALFGQVKVGPRGRFIEWPGEIDFCADALRQQGEVVESMLLAVREESPDYTTRSG